MKLLAISIMVLMQSAAVCQASQVGGVMNEDPLAFSDLVIRCVVESVEATSPFDIPIPGARSRVRVLQVFRGRNPGARMSINVAQDRNALVEGKEYVVCALWHTRDKTYFTAPHLGIYAKLEDAWVRLPARYARNSIDDAPPDTLSEAELRVRLDGGSLRSITKQADLVVMGEVMSVVECDSMHYDTCMTYLTLKPLEMLKGTASIPVTFVIPGIAAAARRNEIRRMPKMSKGQRWLVFLQPHDFGMYPFAGRNSLLELKGNRLIYDSRVACPGTADEILHRVRRQARLERVFKALSPSARRAP